jgi:hypothetical protein
VINELGNPKMNINVENYLKEIQSLSSKNLIESRSRWELLEEQNVILKNNNLLLEELLFEIKKLSEKL